MLIFSDAFASTAGIFTALFLLMLVPTFGMLLVATVTKVRRDRAAHTNWTFPKLFASIQKHAGILTARGWGVLWAGVFFTMAAMCARWASLGTTSVFLLLLLYSVIGVSALISTFRINAFHTSSKRNTGMLRREMSPAVVVSGSPAEERFVLDHVPIPLGFLLVIEDKIRQRLRPDLGMPLGLMLLAEPPPFRDASERSSGSA